MIRIAISLVLLFGSLGSARADDIEAAKLHNKNGARLYDLGRYQEAAKEYELAFEAKDLPEFLFNAAQAYRFAKDYLSAIRFYRSYLRRQPDAANRSEVETRVAELEAMIEQQKRASIESAQSKESGQRTSAVTSSPAPIIATTASTDQRKPLYKRGWFWGTIAGAAVVIAVGIGLGVGLSEGTTYPTANTTLGVVKW